MTASSRTRRVVGKAEHTLEGTNPRFVVTSLKRTRVAHDARALYEDLYCARGEAENHVGEQFELFADRASSATMQANQLRMWFSAMAYVLVDTLRRVGLRFTQFTDAAVATIRLKLLKLGRRYAPACGAFNSPSPRDARATLLEIEVLGRSRTDAEIAHNYLGDFGHGMCRTCLSQGSTGNKSSHYQATRDFAHTTLVLEHL